jgi:hypothetical protein
LQNVLNLGAFWITAIATDKMIFSRGFTRLLLFLSFLGIAPCLDEPSCHLVGSDNDRGSLHERIRERNTGTVDVVQAKANASFALFLDLCCGARFFNERVNSHLQKSSHHKEVEIPL